MKIIHNNLISFDDYDTINENIFKTINSNRQFFIKFENKFGY